MSFLIVCLSYHSCIRGIVRFGIEYSYGIIYYQLIAFLQGLIFFLSVKGSTLGTPTITETIVAFPSRRGVAFSVYQCVCISLCISVCGVCSSLEGTLEH